MKLFSKLLGILLLIFISTTSHAQTFYVCDSTGNDNNLGRSEGMPLKTYNKAMSNFDKLEAGGKILFCRGGNFNIDALARLSNYKCSANKPCLIGAYGDENKVNPSIVSKGAHAFNFENGGDAKQDGGYIIENLTLISNGKNGVGVRLFNDVDDVTIQNVHIEGFALGVYSAGSNKIAKGNSANGMNDRLIIKNSTIINNAKIGFLGGCNSCLIENNHFENNGDTPSFDHNIYLAHTGVHAKGITVRNNTLYRSAIVDGKCQGVSLVGHGHLEDVLIEGNIIKEDLGKVTAGCWGISIDPGYGEHDESFKNIVIRKNKIINVGGVGIGCASCDGISITDNEIIDEGKTITTGIKVPVRQENTLKSKNINIDNNKIILSNQTASGIWVGGEHIASVATNKIALPLSTRGECVSRNQISISINIDSNGCDLHSGVSIYINEQISKSDEGLGQEQITESPNIGDDDLQLDEHEQTQQSEGLDSPSSIEQETTNDITYEEDRTDNISEESSYNSEELDLESNNLKTSEVEQNRSNSQIKSNIGIPKIENELMLSPKSKSLKNSAPSGGGSGSSSSTSSTSASSSVEELEIITDEVSYFEMQIPEKSSSLSPESSEATIGTTDSNTVQNSSPSITKMKDVLQATHEDLSEVDPSQCRASANGKCLMK